MNPSQRPPTLQSTIDHVVDESDRYRDMVASRSSSRQQHHHLYHHHNSNNNNNNNNNNNINHGSGHTRYSLGDGGDDIDGGGGSDTTALQSHPSLERTDSFTTHRRVSESNNSRPGVVGNNIVHGVGGGGFDPDNVLAHQHHHHHQHHQPHRKDYYSGANDDDAESDVDLDFGYSAQDYRDSSIKMPLVSYKKKKDNKSKRGGGSSGSNSARQQQQQRRQQNHQGGIYGRISNDSLRSGTSLSMDDEENELGFRHGEEEDDDDDEEVGMMSGNRTNRSGIGNAGGGGGGHGHDIEAKLPDHGGSLFNSFLNMANSIIGAGII
ncbi:hypothetical protein BG004_003009, partial [Podila humilis]